MKNILKKINKSNCHILSLFIGFCVLSFIAYQFNIALFLLFFLLPILIDRQYHYFSKENYSLILIFGWFILNTFLLSKQANISINTPFFLSNISNILIIAWVNAIYYFYFFTRILKIDKKFISSKILWIIVLLCLFETICFWENKFLYYLIPFAAISFVATLLYIYFLMKVFSKEECIYINLLISISPIIIVLSAWISIFLILQTFDVQKDFRPLFLYGFYYLIFFQIISLSTIIFYFIPANKFNNSNKFIKIISLIILLILISIGIILQTKYGRFFYF